MNELTPGQILYLVAFVIVLFSFVYQFIIRAAYGDKSKREKLSAKQIDLYEKVTGIRYLISSSILLILFLVIGYNSFQLNKSSPVLLVVLGVFILIILINIFTNLRMYKNTDK